MPRKPKMPDAEKVSVLKSKLRRLRSVEAPPLAKMKKPEVVAEIEKREGKSRSVAVSGLEKVAHETAERNKQRKADTAEVKDVMRDLVSRVELTVPEPKAKRKLKSSVSMAL